MHSIKLLCFLCFGIISCSYSYAATPLTQSTTPHFMSVADIHFDPFMSCKTKPCPLIQALEQAPASQWSAIFSRLDTSTVNYGTECNYPLLASSLTAIKKEAQTSQAQFILVIGDFLAHKFDKKYHEYSPNRTKEGYQSFVKKTLEFLTMELHQALPKTDIYVAVGNNDTYDKNYTMERNGLFFKDMGAIGATLIQNRDHQSEMSNFFKRGGYYALTIPQQPNLRLIVLNSVFFSTKAKGHAIDQAAREELMWFHQELKAAAKKHQKALIAMHIPTGIDVYASLHFPFQITEFWKATYTQQFLNEIQQSAPQIFAIFTAHIHADTFQMATVDNNTAIPFIGTPSISPIYGNNPGFKVYHYSSNPTLKLTDISTYYYSLNHDKKWEKEYDFATVYQMDPRHEDIIAGMNHLALEGALAEEYKRFYAVHADNQLVAKEWVLYHWCGIRALTRDQYQKCVSSS